MKPLQFPSRFAVLGLAASITGSSMYVTVQAGVQQDEQAAQAFVEKASPSTAGEESAQEEVRTSAQPLAAAEILSDRDQRIVLGENGSFSGRIVTLGAENAPGAAFTVKVLSSGEVIGATETDDEGRFELSGIAPGVGGIYAEGEEGILIFGVSFVAAEGNLVPAEAELDMDSAVVMKGDVAVVRQLIGEALSSASTVRARFTEETVESDDSFPVGSGLKSTSLSVHAVKLQADGTLKGTINLLDERTGRNREVLDLTLHFVRDGQLIHASKVSHNGAYVATGLTPGLYSLVGTGMDGVFAMGLEVLGSTQDVAKQGDPIPVVLDEPADISVAPTSLENAKAAVPPNDSNDSPSGETPPVADAAGPPAPAGGSMAGTGGSPAGGTGGGGGGGVGGGGGLGSLLGIGIGAGVGYLLGRDDDPASPGT